MFRNSFCVIQKKKNDTKKKKLQNVFINLMQHKCTYTKGK